MSPENFFSRGTLKGKFSQLCSLSSKQVIWAISLPTCSGIACRSGAF